MPENPFKSIRPIQFDSHGYGQPQEW